MTIRKLPTTDAVFAGWGKLQIRKNLSLVGTIASLLGHHPLTGTEESHL